MLPSFASFLILLAILSDESAHQVKGVPVAKRGARFLGKFSLVAGLGLPGGTAVDRGDEYSAPSKSPLSSWGPYFAAVYEPMSFVSSFRDSLGYLVAALDPYSWFTGTSTTSQPECTSDDVLLLVNDDRRPNSNELVNSFNTAPLDSPSNTKVEGQTERNGDLIAEETTARHIVGRPKVESRADDQNNSTMDGSEAANTTLPTMPSNTTMSTMPSNTEMPTMPSNTTTSQNSTGTNNSTTEQWYPDHNNPSHGGYYYGGYPQNVSHIAFTTRPVATRNFLVPPQRPFQDFNEIGQPPRQFSNGDFNSVEPNGRFNGFDLPPLVGNELLQRNDEFSSNHRSTLSSGFKPFFP